MTAHDMESAHEMARESGCSAVFTKPCIPADLVTELRRQLAPGPAVQL
jgi:CheY-like chemotaxis protein